MKVELRHKLDARPLYISASLEVESDDLDDAARLMTAMNAAGQAELRKIMAETFPERPPESWDAVDFSARR